MSSEPIPGSPSPFSSLNTLGTLLRQTREARGLTIPEVSVDTYIRSQYLEALEKGDLNRLPEPVYVQGFLKRYADYLGLEGEEIVRQSALLFGQAPIVPQPISSPLQPRLTVALRPLHLWTAYVVLIVLAIGGLSTLLEGGDNPLARWLPSGTGSSADAPDLPPGAETVKFPQRVFPSLDQWIYIAGVFPQEPRALAPESAGKSVQLDIRVVDRPSWLRVVADGRTVFEDTLQPGAELNWSADESIVVRAGNAGGVLVTLNDQELGLMGDFGEVKEQVFRPENSSNDPVQ